jgi:hypothetical protein
MMMMMILMVVVVLVLVVAGMDRRALAVEAIRLWWF